jgi:hypothetical protein
MALIDDLQNNILTLDDFCILTKRILNYLPEVISTTKETRDYVIIESLTGSTKKYTRPYNSNLFILESHNFSSQFKLFKKILAQAGNGKKTFREEDYNIIDKITYTIQQSIGIALDLLGNQNANRKHVGNRFEELIRLILEEINIRNKKIVLKIPHSKEGIYSCEIDLVCSPYDEVRSNRDTIDKNEIVVSLKTSSKDRMGKIFVDKMLISRFVKRDVKVVGIFLNDVQRKGADKINFTFVAGLFMVYTKFLTKLEGIFFVDPTPHANKKPYKQHIKRFSGFILSEARNLLDTTS